MDQRLSGHDNHVRGFRYYLNRPYIVVPEQIVVSASYIAVTPIALNNKPDWYLRGLAPNQSNVYPVFDLRGNEQRDIQLTEVTWKKYVDMNKSKKAVTGTFEPPPDKAKNGTGKANGGDATKKAGATKKAAARGAGRVTASPSFGAHEAGEGGVLELSHIAVDRSGSQDTGEGGPAESRR